MKIRNSSVIAIVAIASFPVMATAQERGCQGFSTNTKTVALAGPRLGPIVNFTGNAVGTNGALDLLLETTVNITGPGPRVCVTLTFSAQVDPGDNYGVYQASIDNVPMQGHGLLSEYPLTTPVVFDANNQGSYLSSNSGINAANSRMVSYTFVDSVPPGPHRFRIKLAHCCTMLYGNPPPGGAGWPFVRAATMKIAW